MSRISGWRLFSLVGVAIALVGFALQPTTAQAAKASTFVSFESFVKEMTQARYPSMSAAGRTGAVSSPAAFDEMRSYVLGMYRGVTVDHSYLTDEGYFDCVAVQSQPSVRALGGKGLAAPPPSVTAGTKAEPNSQGAVSPLTLGLKDSYGNAVSCRSGTIPMQRLSLDRLTRFSSLRAFLAKSPTGSDGMQAQAASRQYAYGYQNVTNHGGNSWLNLWNPSADFSISQQWYSTGSGSSTQTLEGGWIKYPAKFGNRSVTFIYFTPDNYSSGCYNLDCTGFVQTNSNWSLGGAWSAYSSVGGTQYGFQLQWQYYQGNWWLFLQGAGNFEAVGYYPGSVYRGGAMATSATSALYGGEVAPNGSTWPPMGSGNFASGGFGQAAYQRTIYYIDTNQSTVWTSLNPVETSPSCYTIAYTPAASGGSWGSYFYFGGPGGTNC
jgi:hypothetical protein